MAENEAIYVGWPCAKGRKRCGACGRMVDGNCFLVRAKEPNCYVCNVMCGLKLITSTDKEPVVVNPNEPVVIRGGNDGS